MCATLHTGNRGRCVLYAGGGRDVLNMLEVLEDVRRVLFCMLETVDGEFCLLEVIRRATQYVGGCGMRCNGLEVMKGCNVLTCCVHKTYQARGF
jgi:hypothetical protein